MSNASYRGTAGRAGEAVVLAGGFGTRLAHVVPDVCKPMAPVAGEPFLRRVLDQLDAAGFARVVVADGYRREQIEGYFMGTYRGLEVDYSPEDAPLLTGGAVKRALRLCTQPEVFVLNGDTWLDADFDAMEEKLSTHPGASCCIAAKRMRDFDRYGTLEVTPDGYIRAFREKAPCADGLVNGGTYLIRREALEAETDVFSLESDWFARVVADGALVACETGGGFIDIGVPEDYERAQGMFDGAGNSHRLALFDRDGTINVDTGHMHRIEDCRLIDSTVDAMRRYSDDPEWRVAVVTNQAGIAKGLYSVEDMRLLHRQMAEMLRGRGVEVDAWYFCPHHPDYTGECTCRKPAPGMLLRAMRDFRANPAECVMHGDKESDRLAAARAAVEFEAVASTSAEVDDESSPDDTKPILSIIIPVYNCATTLSECISSIDRSSNRAGEAPIEVIAVDDGSTDDSYTLLQKAAKHQPYLRAVSQTNQGASAARNVGIALARGEYVSFVDADDYVDADYLPVLLPLLKDGDYDCILFGTRSVALNGRTSPVGTVPSRPRETDPQGFYREILDPSSGYQGYVCGKAVRRNLFWRDGALAGFDPSIEILEDEWLWLNLASRCEKVYLCERTLYNYRVRLDSATSAINARGGWDDLEMRDRIVEFASAACPEHAALARWWRRLKTCSMVRRFYVSGDAAALESLRPRWREARKGLPLAFAPIGLKKKAQVILCDIAMQAHVPVGALAPLRRLLSRGNERLKATGKKEGE